MSAHVESGWLPEGWTCEAFHPHRPDVAIIERPKDAGGGMVSLDFTLRVFDGGCQIPRRFPEGRKRSYGGRGWKEQLVRDACAWLEEVMR